MKFISIILVCLILGGCMSTSKKESETKIIYEGVPIVGEAYIYYYENYRGLTKKWQWIKFTEGKHKVTDMARLIEQKHNGSLLLEWYTTPVPGGQTITIEVPWGCFMWYDNRNNTTYYAHAKEAIKKYSEEKCKNVYDNLPEFEMDMRKVKEYGQEVDMFFGMKRKEVR